MRQRFFSFMGLSDWKKNCKFLSQISIIFSLNHTQQKRQEYTFFRQPLRTENY